MNTNDKSSNQAKDPINSSNLSTTTKMKKSPTAKALAFLKMLLHSINKKSKHIWHYLIGDEVKVIDANGNAKFVQSEAYAKRCSEKATLEKVKPAEKKAETFKTGFFPCIGKISIAMPIALLALREFLPGIEEHIPALYNFLDNVVIPIIEWLFRLGSKCVDFLLNQQWISKIVEYINNLSL